MSFRNHCRFAQLAEGHCQRGSHYDEHVIELVGDITSGPAQGADEHIAHLVDGQIKDVCVEITADMCRADRPGLVDFALAISVKPLDQHRRIDQEPRH